MGSLEELYAIEDQRYIDMTDRIIEEHRLRQIRHPWRDIEGLVHVMRAKIDVDDQRKPTVGCWKAICGEKTLSAAWVAKDPRAVPTCLTCLVTDDL